jgi:ABC-type antimicrobial peptide transport system permease subunit
VRVLPFYIALAILAAVLSTVIAAVMPARRAAKLNPVEALR